MTDKKVTRTKVKTYLQRNKKMTQTAIADIFGRTQPWLSQILKEDPDAKLLMVNGEICELEYYVVKVHTRM